MFGAFFRDAVPLTTGYDLPVVKTVPTETINHVERLRIERFVELRGGRLPRWEHWVFGIKKRAPDLSGNPTRGAKGIRAEC